MAPETCYIIDIGQHKKSNLPKVKRLLKSGDIIGYKVFTEASDAEVKRRHPFFGPLSKFLSKQQAIEIHEPGYEASMKLVSTIYEDTLDPVLRALRKSKFGWQPDTIVAESDRFNAIVCLVRDPIIAKVIIDNDPAYSIFGPGHTPGVLAILKEQACINIEVIPLFLPHRLRPLTSQGKMLDL